MKYHIRQFAVFAFVLTLLSGVLSGGLSASPALVSYDPPRDSDRLREILIVRLSISIEEPDRLLVLAPCASPERPPVWLPGTQARCREYSRALEANGYTGAYC